MIYTYDKLYEIKKKGLNYSIWFNSKDSALHLHNITYFSFKNNSSNILIPDIKVEDFYKFLEKHYKNYKSIEYDNEIDSFFFNDKEISGYDIFLLGHFDEDDSYRLDPKPLTKTKIAKVFKEIINNMFPNDFINYEEYFN